MSMRITVRRKRMLRKAERPDAVPLNLVSMIDVFTTLVFFLLLTSTNIQTIRSPRSITLPNSTSVDTPADTPVVMVSPDYILWQGNPVMNTKDAQAVSGNVLQPLRAQLLASPLVALQNASQAGAMTRGDINILADKGVPFSLLKKVMATCGDAKFARISLSVNHFSGGTP